MAEQPIRIVLQQQGDYRFDVDFERSGLARFMRTMGATFEVDPPLPATLNDNIKCRRHVRPAKTPQETLASSSPDGSQKAGVTHRSFATGGQSAVFRCDATLRERVLPY